MTQPLRRPITARFENELGNPIRVSVEDHDDATTTVRMRMIGPNSEVENLVTRLEAEKLNQALARFLAMRQSKTAGARSRLIARLLNPGTQGAALKQLERTFAAPKPNIAPVSFGDAIDDILQRSTLEAAASDIRYSGKDSPSAQQARYAELDRLATSGRHRPSPEGFGEYEPGSTLYRGFMSRGAVPRLGDVYDTAFQRSVFTSPVPEVAADYARPTWSGRVNYLAKLDKSKAESFGPSSSYAPHGAALNGVTSYPAVRDARDLVQRLRARLSSRPLASDKSPVYEKIVTAPTPDQDWRSAILELWKALPSRQGFQQVRKTGSFEQTDDDQRPYRDRAELYALKDGKLFGSLFHDGGFGVYGGGIDEGEDAATAAAREFAEESGWNVSNVRPLPFEPNVLDWKPPYETEKLRERAEKYRGSRTHYLVGELGDPIPNAKVDELGRKDVRLYDLDEALRLANPPGKSETLQQANRRRVEILKYLRSAQAKTASADSARLAQVRALLAKFREEADGAGYHYFAVASDPRDPQAGAEVSGILDHPESVIRKHIALHRDWAAENGLQDVNWDPRAYAPKTAQTPRTAWIIRGNPKFVDDNPSAGALYEQLRELLASQGYAAKFHRGEPHTAPPDGDVWIGHSRGADRLRFAPAGTTTIPLGSHREGAINHPDDDVTTPFHEVGGTPPAAHYELTDDMRKAILARIGTKTAAESYSPIAPPGTGSVKMPAPFKPQIPSWQNRPAIGAAGSLGSMGSNFNPSKIQRANDPLVGYKRENGSLVRQPVSPRQRVDTSHIINGPHSQNPISDYATRYANPVSRYSRTNADTFSDIAGEYTRRGVGGLPGDNTAIRAAEGLGAGIGFAGDIESAAYGGSGMDAIKGKREPGVGEQWAKNNLPYHWGEYWQGTPRSVGEGVGWLADRRTGNSGGGLGGLVVDPNKPFHERTWGETVGGTALDLGQGLLEYIPNPANPPRQFVRGAAPAIGTLDFVANEIPWRIGQGAYKAVGDPLRYAAQGVQSVARPLARSYATRFPRISRFAAQAGETVGPTARAVGSFMRPQTWRQIATTPQWMTPVGKFMSKTVGTPAAVATGIWDAGRFVNDMAAAGSALGDADTQGSALERSWGYTPGAGNAEALNTAEMNRRAALDKGYEDWNQATRPYINPQLGVLENDPNADTTSEYFMGSAKAQSGRQREQQVMDATERGGQAGGGPWSWAGSYAGGLEERLRQPVTHNLPRYLDQMLGLVGEASDQQFAYGRDLLGIDNGQLQHGDYFNANSILDSPVIPTSFGSDMRASTLTPYEMVFGRGATFGTGSENDSSWLARQEARMRADRAAQAQ